FCLGTGLAIKVKDAHKVEQGLARLAAELKKLVPAGQGEAVRLNKHAYRGVNYHVLQISGLPVAPSWVLHDGWLVLELYPQQARSFICGTRRLSAVWHPPAITAEAVQKGLKAGNANTRFAYLTVDDPRTAVEFWMPLVPVAAQYLVASANLQDAGV